jgi:hypothetical protein
MRKFLSLIVLASAASAVAAPAAAAPPAQRAASLSNTLSLRLRSIELQIDILRDRGAIGGEEAHDLRTEARRLEQRLYRPSVRELHDLDLAIDRLQEQLRFASASTSLSSDLSRRRDLGRFDDGDRYRRDQDSYDDHDSYRRADPRGDPFAIWKERDERGPH